MAMLISSEEDHVKSVMYEGYTVFENGVILGRRGKPMVGVDNGRGYLIVSLYLNKKTTTLAVHKLVAMCFVENPENLPEVDHIDGDKLNNHYSNLRWVTRGFNIEHAYNLKARSAKGEDNARAIATEGIVHEICQLLQEGLMPAKIRDMGYDYSLVRSVRMRKNWTYISDEYTWS